MKKARATKILCAVLTVIMVLGTGLSAMAAVTSTSVVKYSADKTAYGVTTEVSGLAENEMVTYLVHNASSMYNVTPSNIDFVDQKNADGTTASFNYKGTGDWATKNNTIYVGAESLAAPVTSAAESMEEGVAVYVNGVMVKGLTVEGADAAGVKTIALDYANEVVDVAYNGTAVEFFKNSTEIGFATDAALDADTGIINITTKAATITGDPASTGVLSAADIIAMGKAIDPATQAVIVNDNGTISGWAGLLSNIRGNSTNSSQGEQGSANFWYKNQFTLAQSGYDVSAMTVEFNEKYTPAGLGVGSDGKPISGNEWPASVKEQVHADYNAGKTSTTFDASSFVANGITLNNKAGAEIEVEFNVAVPGNYKLISRAAAWTADRKVVLTFADGKQFATTRGEDNTQLTLGASDAIYLEAGTYAAKLNANVNAPVRLDFIALVPATAATEAAYAAGKEALVAYLDGDVVDGEVGIKLGTVKAEGNSFVAFGRVRGNYSECGIEIMNGDNYEAFPALGVAGQSGMANGGFAIELIDEDGVDLAEEFNGAEVNAYAYDALGGFVMSEVYTYSK